MINNLAMNPKDRPEELTLDERPFNGTDARPTRGFSSIV